MKVQRPLGTLAVGAIAALASLGTVKLLGILLLTEPGHEGQIFVPSIWVDPLWCFRDPLLLAALVTALVAPWLEQARIRRPGGTAIGLLGLYAVVYTLRSTLFFQGSQRTLWSIGALVLGAWAADGVLRALLGPLERALRETASWILTLVRVLLTWPLLYGLLYAGVLAFSEDFQSIARSEFKLLIPSVLVAILPTLEVAARWARTE